MLTGASLESVLQGDTNSTAIVGPQNKATSVDPLDATQYSPKLPDSDEAYARALAAEDQKSLWNGNELNATMEANNTNTEKSDEEQQ